MSDSSKTPDAVYNAATAVIWRRGVVNEVEARDTAVDVLYVVAPLLRASGLRSTANELEAFLRETGDHGFLAAGLREFIRSLRFHADELDGCA